MYIYKKDKHLKLGSTLKGRAANYFLFRVDHFLKVPGEQKGQQVMKVASPLKVAR